MNTVNRAQTQNYALSSAFQQPPSSARFTGGCFSAPTHVSRETTIAAPFAAPSSVAAGTTPEKSVPTGPQNRLDKADSSRDHRCRWRSGILTAALIGKSRHSWPSKPGDEKPRNAS